jgi:hypothetical protein
MDDARSAVADILDPLFRADALQRLRKQQNPSPTLTRRIDILTAVETSGAELSVRTWQRILIAHRRAWADYVTCMKEAGFLDADVIARLTGPDDDGFRSAMAECMTCHFLRCVLGLAVFGRHEGRPGSLIDFSVKRPDGDLSVEVKSPFAEKPAGAYWGDHSHILTPVLDIANKQFAEGRRNVLVLAPLVEWPVLHGRMPYVSAFFGEEKIVFQVDKATGRMAGEPHAQFITAGKFLKLDRTKPVRGGLQRSRRTHMVCAPQSVFPASDSNGHLGRPSATRARRRCHSVDGRRNDRWVIS